SSISFFVMRRLPSSSLFPYTTLFRSLRLANIASSISTNPKQDTLGLFRNPDRFPQPIPLHPINPTFSRSFAPITDDMGLIPPPRSEEHTSELQSRENLVCRLLLEKKN